MRKLYLKIFFLSAVFYLKNAIAEPEKKPWLLTDDYGVLSKDDIATTNIDNDHPIPNTPDEKDVYKHWQCFQAKQVNLQCRSWPDDKPDQFMGEADIDVDTDTEHHNYGFRRAWDLNVCLSYLKDWKRLAKNQDAICLLGIPAGEEQKKVNGKSILVQGWVWDRLKTKKGCISYFEGECDAKHWKKMAINGDFYLYKEE